MIHSDAGRTVWAHPRSDLSMYDIAIHDEVNVTSKDIDAECVDRAVSFFVHHLHGGVRSPIHNGLRGVSDPTLDQVVSGRADEEVGVLAIRPSEVATADEDAEGLSIPFGSVELGERRLSVNVTPDYAIVGAPRYSGRTRPDTKAVVILH